MSRTTRTLSLASALWLVAAGCSTFDDGASDDVFAAQEPEEPSWWESATSFMRPEPDEGQAREAFRRAEELFAAKDFGGARSEYESAAALAPDSMIEEDAMFMVGECYFFEDRYPKADEAYGELLKKYTNTRHLDKVTARLYAVATYWRDIDREKPRNLLRPNLTDKTRPIINTTGGALGAYRAVWTNDPKGPLADDSVMQLANTYFVSEDWDEADSFYTQLRQDYPNSKHLVQAYLLGYQAKLRKYQGPGYDPTPLVEAEELVETLLMQFADQLGPERERVVRARAIVRGQLAERDWLMAEYLRRGGHNRGASMYYRGIIKSYPETPFAKMAGEKLAEIAGEPPEPPDRFGWLGYVFKSNREVPKPIEPDFGEGEEAVAVATDQPPRQ